MRRSDRGLIVERSGRRVTALRRDGDLVTFNTDRDDIMIGMEIEVPVKMAFFTWRRLAPAVALSLVIVLVSSFGYQHYLHAQPVVAYVTLDSTGSIELEVNQAGIVKSAKALDAAGQEALSAVQYQNRPAGEVVQELIKAQDPENKSGVVVALVPVADPEPTGKEAKKTEKTMDRLERKVTESAGSSRANMTSLRLDPEIRDSAQELGISAGRAALWALTQPTTDPDPGEDPGGTQPGPEPTTDPGQTTVPGDPGDTVDPGDPVDPGVTADPGDPGEPEDPGDPDSPQGNILDTIKGSLPKVDPDDWPGHSKNSKEREEMLKDITKKWLQEVSKQVGKGKHDDDDPDDDQHDDQDDDRDDDRREDDKKNPPGQSKGNDGKGSQGKGNSSGSDSPGGNTGKGSSGSKQGTGNDNKDDHRDDNNRRDDDDQRDDDDDDRRDDDDNRRGDTRWDDDDRRDDGDAGDSKNTTGQGGYWSGKGLSDFFGGWLNRLPWRRK